MKNDRRGTRNEIENITALMKQQEVREKDIEAFRYLAAAIKSLDGLVFPGDEIPIVALNRMAPKKGMAQYISEYSLHRKSGRERRNEYRIYCHKMEFSLAERWLTFVRVGKKWYGYTTCILWKRFLLWQQPRQ